MAAGSLSHELARIDWRHPWFEPWAPWGLPLVPVVCGGVPVHQALDACATRPLEFVSAHALPQGASYEQHIWRHWQVPTRDCLHDLLNGLAWLRFPRLKRRLNELHVAELNSRGVGNRRGPLRDALTLLDENGAFLLAPAAVCDAVGARDWVGAFVRHRALWSQARLVLFGHALLEKLVTPRKDITAHACLLPDAAMPGNDAALDRILELWAQPELLAAKPFCPLPVMGVPGWDPDNGQDSFYDDRQVFRPAVVRGIA